LIQFVNGKLVEEKIISQFASIASGDLNKLMDMYDTFNFCSNLTSKIRLIFIIFNETANGEHLWLKLGGMDACDKVSRLLKCGKDNSPEIVNGLIKNLENGLSVII